MKTILSFIDWYLPGYRAGGTLKAFANQVAHLEGVYHFKIVTRDTDYCETTPYAEIESNTWIRVAPNAEVYYISSDQLRVGTFRKIVNQTAFDAVFIHGVYSFYFSILPVVLTSGKRKHTVISAHGMLGGHALEVKSGKKRLFLKVVKAAGFYRRVVFHAANDAEAADVKNALGPDVKVQVAEELPMKVDLSEPSPRQKVGGKVKLCSVARISPEKNTRYALERLRDVQDAEIEYDIYGPVYNQEYWAECQQIIAQLPPQVVVRYKGSLPGHAVLDTIGEYHAMFMPTNGENFGHTILESLMAATPVIISQNTPWKSLAERYAGWDLPLDDPQAFLGVLQQLAGMHQEEYDRWSQGAFEHARRFMQNSEIREQNIKLFEDE